MTSLVLFLIRRHDLWRLIHWLRLNFTKRLNLVNDISRDVKSSRFPFAASSSRWSPLPTSTQLGEVACGVPPRQEGLVPLSATPRTRLPARCRRRSHRDPLSPQLSLTTLCWTAQSPTQKWRPTLTTARCWPLLPASWRPIRGQTNYTPLWWGEQMASNWPLFPSNSAWHFSPPTPNRPDSILKCELVTRWLRWTEPLKFWLSRWAPTSPSPLTPAIVSSGLRGLLASWKP